MLGHMKLLANCPLLRTSLGGILTLMSYLAIFIVDFSRHSYTLLCMFDKFCQENDIISVLEHVNCSVD